MCTRPRSTPSTSATLTSARTCTPTSFFLVVLRYAARTSCAFLHGARRGFVSSLQLPSLTNVLFVRQMYEGLPERMSKEITNLAPNSMKIKVVAPPESMLLLRSRSGVHTCRVRELVLLPVCVLFLGFLDSVKLRICKPTNTVVRSRAVFLRQFVHFMVVPTNLRGLLLYSEFNKPAPSKRSKDPTTGPQDHPSMSLNSRRVLEISVGESSSKPRGHPL